MPSVMDVKTVTRREILAMMHEKEILEEELKNLLESLHSYGVGMNEPLVDADNYPRIDVDVYRIRLTRNRIICIRNDLRDVRERIEKGLNTYFTQGHHNETEYVVNGHSNLKPDQ